LASYSEEQLEVVARQQMVYCARKRKVTDGELLELRQQKRREAEEDWVGAQSEAAILAALEEPPPPPKLTKTERIQQKRIVALEKAAAIPSSVVINAGKKAQVAELEAKQAEEAAQDSEKATARALAAAAKKQAQVDMSKSVGFDETFEVRIMPRLAGVGVTGAPHITAREYFGKLSRQEALAFRRQQRAGQR
jgi:hypothetical protein